MPTKSKTYILHGCVVASELLLDAPETVGSPDLTVSRIEVRPEPFGVRREILRFPQGRAFVPSGSRYAFVLEFNDLCAFYLEANLQTVDVFAETGVDSETLALFCSGNLINFILALKGVSVLHASGIGFDGGCIAFSGDRGSGKSTLAAICCAAGASLVTDDLLRLGTRNGGLVGFPGTNHIRLRPQTASLAVNFSAKSNHFDGRIAVKATEESSRLPMKAVIFPRSSPSGQEVVIEPCSAREAMRHLLASSRMKGWIDMEPEVHQLRFFGAVARAIPCATLGLPLGWQEDLDADRLLSLLRSVPVGPR